MKKISNKHKINPIHATAIIFNYTFKKIKTQFKAVFFISLYLLIFQKFVLSISLPNPFLVFLGLLIVSLGLALFMEGLNLSFMPLGQQIGYELLNQKPFSSVLVVALFLGFVATLAEPANAILQTGLYYLIDKNIGNEILSYLLNPHKSLLILILALGIGLATFFATWRNIKGVSLKPFIFVLVPICLVLSLILSLNPHTKQAVSLVWDAVCIATGPVTVPLIIAFGLGVSRLKKDKSTSDNELGLGAVTIAGLIPIILVMLYILIVYYFVDYNHIETFKYSKNIDDWLAGFFNLTDNVVVGQVLSSLGSILPILSVLTFVLVIFLQVRPSLMDEKYFGVIITTVGLILLGIGIKVGIVPIVSNLDKNMASMFISKTVVDENKKDSVILNNFNLTMVEKAQRQNGLLEDVFLYDNGYTVQYEKFDMSNYDPIKKTYRLVVKNASYITDLKETYRLGIYIVLAFLLGLGLVLAFAEPMLVTIGNALEEHTAGALKKDFLVLLVAIGLSIGLVVGTLRIVHNIDFIYFIVPIYIVLMTLTYFSSDFMVNVAWDSAGVSSGPITVIVIMIMGFSLGSNLKSSDIFGLISITSAFPILVILAWSIINSFYEKKLLKNNGITT